MLVIERGLRVLRGLPRLTQLGIGALMVGLAIDLLAHMGWASGLVAGHLVTLAGMVLATIGVLTLAVHRPREVPLAEKRR
jgi:hypothetical protein